MKLTLSLMFEPQPGATATAWLIPGSDVSTWVAQLATWEVPHSRLQLLVVGSHAAAPVGLLIVPPSSAMPSAPATWQAYHVEAERLYLPLEGSLGIATCQSSTPVLAPGELAKLLPSPDALYVWHPVVGLIAYEASQWLRIGDLLEPPVKLATPWDRAEPGSALAKRLISIEPEQTPTLDELMQMARGDIGNDAGALEKLPKHPDERSMLGKAAQSALGNAAKAMQWAAGNVPGMGAGGPLSQMQEWARQQVEQLAQSLSVERNKELARLLRMLDDNPDEGLRYALPLAGDAAPRGLARPGSQLVKRDTNFSLGRLGGGGAVDGWDAGQYRLKLMQRYRELANRELTLGRHRRAAYIFAELLGDLTAAANALENGAHYREAALLYEQRLSQPLQAARCLAKGALWAEAIGLYEKLGEHERVGELYLELKDQELAHRAFHEAIKTHSLRGDFLSAARIAEQRLDDVDSAFALLSSQWPESRHAARCLEEMFALLARHHRHDTAEQWVRKLGQQQLQAEAPLQAIERLSKLATDYPHPPVRTLAADRTRILIADRLEQGVPQEASALMQAIRRLVPGDRLLGRDADRYLQRKGRPPRKPSPRATGMQMLRGYHLPVDAQWKSAVGLNRAFYLAGWRGSEVVVAQVDEDDNVQMSPSTWRMSPDDGPIGGDLLLAAHESDATRVYLHAAAHPPLRRDLVMPLVSKMVGRTAERVQFTAHPGLSRQTRGLQYENGSLTSLEVDFPTQQMCLSYYAADDQLMATTAVDFSSLTDQPLYNPIHFHALREKYLIAVQHLLVIHDAGNLTLEHFEYPITCIATHRHFAIGMTRGALIFWDDRLNGRREQFAHDLESPRLAFLESGHLIAAAANGIEVYATNGNQLRLIGKQQAPREALAIVPGKSPYQFRVIFQDGRVRVYQIVVSA